MEFYFEIEIDAGNFAFDLINHVSNYSFTPFGCENATLSCHNFCF